MTSNYIGQLICRSVIKSPLPWTGFAGFFPSPSKQHPTVAAVRTILHTRELRIWCLRHWWQWEERNGCHLNLSPPRWTALRLHWSSSVKTEIAAKPQRCSEDYHDEWKTVSPSGRSADANRSALAGWCPGSPLYHAASSWIQSPSSTSWLETHEWKN